MTDIEFESETRMDSNPASLIRHVSGTVVTRNVLGLLLLLICIYILTPLTNFILRLFQMDGFHASEFSSSQWRDWADLPGHLLFDITDKFTNIDDFVQFGRVCITWQNIFLLNTKNLGSPLLLVDPPNDENYHTQRCLYSPSTKSICNFKLQLPHSKICRGSSFGWLVTMEEKGEDCYHVQLQNPFHNRTINLPSLDSVVKLHPDEYGYLVSSHYIYKAVLSSDPSTSDDFIVMGIMSRYLGLAFFKAGNKCWTSIEDWSFDSMRFADVIFFRKVGQFYALLIRGAVLAIEFGGDEGEPKLIQVAPPLASHQHNGCGKMHLVEDLASGDLLQVRRMEVPTEEADQNGKSHILVQFHIYKFDPMEQRWTQIHNLGDKVLFIGNTNSVLRSASDCPGCVPNCIYYKSIPDWDTIHGRKPLGDGIYNLEDGTVQQHYSTPYNEEATPPATIWLEPALSKQRPIES